MVSCDVLSNQKIIDMINRLITFSIKNKLIIGLFTLALIGLGVWSMLQVPIDAVPEIGRAHV